MEQFELIRFNYNYKILEVCFACQPRRGLKFDYAIAITNREKCNNYAVKNRGINSKLVENIMPNKNNKYELTEMINHLILS